MKILATALGLGSFVALMGASSMMPAAASADPVETSYVACNQYGDCWRVHDRYAYGPDAPITYYNSDWYAAHQSDEHVHWLADPADEAAGTTCEDGSWHADPGARALVGGAAGAGVARRHRVYRDASDWVRPGRGRWRRRRRWHWRRRRCSLNAELIDASADRSGSLAALPGAAAEEVRNRPGLLSLVLVLAAQGGRLIRSAFWR